MPPGRCTKAGAICRAGAGNSEVTPTSGTTTPRPKASRWTASRAPATLPSKTAGRTDAMYVESINSDGTINISQYNADLAGHFSRVYNLSPNGLVFVHF